MSDDIRSTVLARINSEAERIKVKSDALRHISERVKREPKNIRKVLNTCLSAFTDNPSNMAYASESSTGKTYLVESVSDYFPDECLIVLRSISPKSFTRLRGKIVFKEISDEGASYNETLMNVFTQSEMGVASYLEFLKSEIDKRDSEYDKEKLKVERSRISESLYTLIDFTNKILVLLERPARQFWNDMLTVMSHDKQFQESMFVEGEGKKYTKQIVYRGYPAILFCTSRDQDLAWKDLETRFEIAEPDKSNEKFREAIDLSLREEFEIVEADSEKPKIKSRIRELTGEIIRDRPKPYIPESKEIRRAFLGDRVEQADLMRKFPRIVRHIGMNTLWNYRSRVVFRKGNDVRVLVGADDFRELKEEFSDTELNATLHGLPETLYTFVKDALIPACTRKDADDNPIIVDTKQSEVCSFLAGLDNSGIGKTKMSCSNYLRDVEKRGLIDRRKDPEDRRGQIVYPLVDKLSELKDSMEDNIEKLVKLYGTLLPENIDRLLRQGYTAFHRNVDIVKTNIKTYENDENPDHEDYSGDPENNDSLITQIMSISGYSSYVLRNAFTNFSQLRFTEDVPPIAWENGKTYQYRKNDIAHVPERLAAILVQRNVAIEIKEMKE